MPGILGEPRKPAKHSLKNRYKTDPRTEAQRIAEGTPGHPARRLDRQYFCSCGKVFGNIRQVDAEAAQRRHAKEVGAT